jgi:uncharacterized protein (DUF58 family)
MSASRPLVPPTIEGQARAFGRLPVAFGPRFFVLLLVGLVWLAPAFAEPRFVYAMAGWDLLALLAWAADARSLPPPARLRVRRTWLAPASLSVEAHVSLTVVNGSDRIIRARVLDHVPRQLRSDPPEVQLNIGPRAAADAQYHLRPTERGGAVLGDAYVRYQTPMRIAERWARVDLAQTVVTYPNLEDAKRESMLFIQSRQAELQKRSTRHRGAGRTFESLRDYQQGDEFRDICWTASARRGRLVTRLYEIEKSQTLWIVLDAGRLMRTRVGGLSKLDCAVNAALALSQVALYSGDRVGLLAYGRRIAQRLPAARGSQHLRQIVEQLAAIREGEWESDHFQAAARLLTDQTRRCLVVWVTDVAETAMRPEVIEASAQLAARHLVLVVVIGQADLQTLAASNPTSARQMYQTAAAQEVLHRRELLLARLREQGALALEATSGRLTPSLVNAYLEIKQRSQL